MKKKPYLCTEIRFTTMEKQQVLEQLREVVNTGKATAEQKRLIVDTCKELGITIAKTNCKECIIDAAVQCYGRLADKADEGKEAEAHEDAPKYVLRKGVDVLFGGMRVNAATINDDFARAIVARGFDLRWFAKYPQE